MKVHVVEGVRLVVAAMLSFVVAACGASEGESGPREVGFKISEAGSAREIGLPAYPGATPYEDGDDDSNAADVGISTPWFGLKVVAVELETRDQPEKVAVFYRKALAKYGDVLECSDRRDVDSDAAESSGDTEGLTCHDDEPGSHSIVYKVGTKNNQRIVAIKPHRGGTQFSLVHLNVRDDD